VRVPGCGWHLDMDLNLDPIFDNGANKKKLKIFFKKYCIFKIHPYLCPVLLFKPFLNPLLNTLFMYSKQKKIISVVSDSGIKIESEQIKNSTMSADLARKMYDNDIDVIESFYVMILSRSNKLKHWAKISQGGVSGTFVDVRVICKHVVDCLGSAVIIVHNHPSGNFQPSEQDKQITKKIKQALEIFDVSLLDHLILTEDDHFSFADNGLI
jgi:DNA repair protein RadC